MAKGAKDEVAFGDAGVRNGDEGAGAADVAKEQDVDIDRTVVVDAISSVVIFHFQVASELFFNGFDAVQDAEAVLEAVLGAAGYFVADAKIEKAVWAVKAHRLGFYDFGDARIAPE